MIDNSFRSLCNNTIVLGEKNLGKIEELEKRKENQVIVAFEYKLECNLEGGISEEENRDDSSETKIDPSTYYKLHTEKKTKECKDFLESWRYDGVALQREILFGEKIDMNLAVYVDLVRLAKELNTLGVKFNKFMVSGPETFEALTALHANMQIIESALSEVDKLTTDRVDRIAESEDFKKGIHSIVSGYQKVSQFFPGVTLQMMGDLKEKDDETRENSVNFYQCTISNGIHSMFQTRCALDNLCM